MKEPASKPELLRAIRASRAEWGALIAQIPHAWLFEAVAPGQWSVKDIIVHFTEYERWLALGLELRLQKPSQMSGAIS